MSRIYYSPTVTSSSELFIHIIHTHLDCYSCQIHGTIIQEYENDVRETQLAHVDKTIFTTCDVEEQVQCLFYLF